MITLGGEEGVMRFEIETDFCIGVNRQAGIIRVEGHPDIVVAGVAAYLRTLERQARDVGPLRVHGVDGTFVKDCYDDPGDTSLRGLLVGESVSLDVSPDGAAQNSTVWATRCPDEAEESWTALVGDPDRPAPPAAAVAEAAETARGPYQDRLTEEELERREEEVRDEEMDYQILAYLRSFEN